MLGTSCMLQLNAEIAYVQILQVFSITMAKRKRFCTFTKTDKNNDFYTVLQSVLRSAKNNRLLKNNICLIIIRNYNILKNLTIQLDL